MRIFSGIQPTGTLHIGNYLGAVRQWIQLQKEHECLFCVVDLHALTVPQDPEALRNATREKVIELLAVGLDPARCTIFVQSHVPQHTELAWILATLTPLSELERMTQYKDKAKKYQGHLNAGLLNYPVLMAADVLLHLTDAVPVGKDQTQHLELTRILARKFNNKYGKIFKEPKTLMPAQGAKVMSLQEPTKKMSKSDAPESFISVFEEPKVIKEKIAKAVTDKGKEMRYDPERKPGISNLLMLYSLFSEQPIKTVEKNFRGKGYAVLKKSLAELLCQKLEPMRKKKKELSSRDIYVQTIIKQGAVKARSIASNTMELVRSKVGLLVFS